MTNVIDATHRFKNKNHRAAIVPKPQFALWYPIKPASTPDPAVTEGGLALLHIFLAKCFPTHSDVILLSPGVEGELQYEKLTSYPVNGGEKLCFHSSLSDIPFMEIKVTNEPSHFSTVRATDITAPNKLFHKALNEGLSIDEFTGNMLFAYTAYEHFFYSIAVDLLGTHDNDFELIECELFDNYTFSVEFFNKTDNVQIRCRINYPHLKRYLKELCNGKESN